MDIMFVLIWTMLNFPLYYINTDETLGDYGCNPANCIVTESEEILGNDFSKFNAVMFDVFLLHNLDFNSLPQRKSYQKYIAINIDPPYKFDFNESRFDSFFNWTASYRLDSDIPYPFLAIKDDEGNDVGPKIDMHWKSDMKDNLDEGLVNRLKNKTRAAAWFASDCDTPSKRTEYIYELDYALSRYGLRVDMYGKCGNLKCPDEGGTRLDSYSKCDKMLGQKYFFYLAFENSFSQDYVTEKLLRAVTNDVVPVVYGGANYSRFLPPDSYLDARLYAPQEMGFIMKELILKPTEYRRFFRWKSYYTFHDAMRNVNICSICAALNNKTKFETKSVYRNIREWHLSR